MDLIRVSSAGCEHVLQALDGSHVLGALEGSWIGAAELAHAALHLLHGFIFVLFHPLSGHLVPHDEDARRHGAVEQSTASLHPRRP